VDQWKKNIVLFLGSQTVSLFGSSLVQYAIMWYITLHTQSGVMMTISIICGFVPTFFLSPFAGVWADRYQRKMLIIAADLLIAVATLILAFLFLWGYEAIWLLFLMSAIRAVGTGIHTPAVGAVIPQLVPEKMLTKVNGINGSIQAFVMLLSPVASGLLLTMASIEMIFFVDVVTAAIAIALLLAFVKIPAHAKAMQSQATSYFNDLMEGIRYIRNHDAIKQLFVFLAFTYFLAAPAAFLTPLQVARSFGEEVWRLTAIEITFSIGMMAGGVLMSTWGGFANRAHTLMLSCIIFGLCTLALGIVPVFWLYLLFMTIVGIAMPLFSTPSTVMLQEKVDGDFMGRIFGVFGMISTSMMPLGMLVFGPVADLIRIEWLLVATGALLSLLGAAIPASKALMEAGKPAAAESEHR